MPPMKTTAAERSTPIRSRLPMTISICSSRQSWLGALISSADVCENAFCPSSTLEPPRNSIENHLEGKRKNHQTKDGAQHLNPCEHEETRAEQRTHKHTQHHRHREPWVNIASIKVDTCTRRRSNPDHKVTRGGRDLEGDGHRLIHCQHFYRSRSDA